MPVSNRMRWPIPSLDQDPWFDAFLALVNAQDASILAAMENDQTILMGGGEFTFNAGTGVVTWDAAIEITSPMTGFLHTIVAGNVTVLDGQFVYCALTRSLSVSEVLTFSVASQRPPATAMENFFIFGIRRGTKFYLRNGEVLDAGTPSSPIEDPGSGGGGGAVVFDDAVPADKVNIRSDRASNQSPIDNTQAGITNFGNADGDWDNTATGATGKNSTIGGGDDHTASGENSVVPGGASCYATGLNSLAANEYAEADGEAAAAFNSASILGDYAFGANFSSADGFNSFGANSADAQAAHSAAFNAASVQVGGTDGFAANSAIAGAANAAAFNTSQAQGPNAFAANAGTASADRSAALGLGVATALGAVSAGGTASGVQAFAANGGEASGVQSSVFGQWSNGGPRMAFNESEQAYSSYSINQGKWGKVLYSGKIGGGGGGALSADLFFGVLSNKRLFFDDPVSPTTPTTASFRLLATVSQLQAGVNYSGLITLECNAKWDGAGVVTMTGATAGQVAGDPQVSGITLVPTVALSGGRPVLRLVLTQGGVVGSTHCDCFVEHVVNVMGNF